MKTLIVAYLAFVAVGCQGTTADLATYREGLYKIDHPAYASNVQSMGSAVALGAAYNAASASPNDATLQKSLQAAVKAAIRTPADLQAVQAEQAGMESIYATSKSHDTTSTSGATIPTGQ